MATVTSAFFAAGLIYGPTTDRVIEAAPIIRYDGPDPNPGADICPQEGLADDHFGGSVL